MLALYRLDDTFWQPTCHAQTTHQPAINVHLALPYGWGVALT